MCQRVKIDLQLASALYQRALILQQDKFSSAAASAYGSTRMTPAASSKGHLYSIGGKSIFLWISNIKRCLVRNVFTLPVVYYSHVSTTTFILTLFY